MALRASPGSGPVAWPLVGPVDQPETTSPILRSSLRNPGIYRAGSPGRTSQEIRPTSNWPAAPEIAAMFVRHCLGILFLDRATGNDRAGRSGHHCRRISGCAVLAPAGPIGKQIAVDDSGFRTVVGVVGQTRYRIWLTPMQSVYVPYRQTPFMPCMSRFRTRRPSPVAHFVARFNALPTVRRRGRRAHRTYG